jgi:hypothetical protein
MSQPGETDSDIPDRETCQKLTEQFAEITGTDEACAQFYLQDRNWNLEVSDWAHNILILQWQND